MKKILSNINGLVPSLDVNNLRDFVDKKVNNVFELGDAAKESLSEATEKSVNIMKNVAENNYAADLISTVKDVAETSWKDVKIYTENVIDLNVSHQNESNISTQLEAKDKIEKAIETLEGKDKVGVLGEGLAAVGGAAAGVAAAGSIASAAGATTLLGSTTLASTLGGVFVTTTPVGWIVGAAAVAGAAGYGISKLVRSGSEQDQIREQIIKRFKDRLIRMSIDHSRITEIDELRELLPIMISNDIISEDQANRMLKLIESGNLSPSLALQRLREMSIKST